MLTPAAKKLDCSVSVVTPENIEFQYALAGPFQRLPAFLFDIVVRIVAFVLLLVVIAFIFSWVSLGLLATVVSYFLLYFLMSWFYGAYFESRFNGRTLGKMVFGLRVISVDGRPINAVQAGLRNLLRLADMGAYVSLQALDAEIAAFVIPTLSIGLLSMMLTNRYQRLGDLVAGTIVITENRQKTPWNLQPDDVRAFGLAELIPASYPISSSLAQTVGLYMENRQRLYPARRAEVAKHVAAPLIRKFELLPDTSYDLFMCALYARIFLSDEQRARGLEEMRKRQPAAARLAVQPGVAPGSLLSSGSTLAATVVQPVPTSSSVEAQLPEQSIAPEISSSTASPTSPAGGEATAIPSGPANPAEPNIPAGPVGSTDPQHDGDAQNG